MWDILMKFFIVFFLASSTLLSPMGWAASNNAALPAYQESSAYKQYQRRPKNELSKLIYVMDRYKGSDYKVIFNKVEYDSLEALKYAKSYIAKNYKKEPAESWIKEHAYKSPSGQVIYLKEPSGKVLPLRDALVKELQPLK